MPLYFFILETGEKRIADESGTEFPDDASARNYAMRIIRELEEDSLDDRPSELIVICGEREVFRARVRGAQT
jgi:hypothetical protein